MSIKAIRDAIQQATHFHQTGNLDRANQIYQQILRVEPKNADTLHLSGVIACQRNEYERAMELISAAIAIKPNESGYQNSLGNALRGVDRLADSIAAFRRACGLDPKNLAALNNLGTALDDDDQTAAALECFDRLIAIKSDVAQWHANRGSVQYNIADYPSAIASQRKAIALQPDLAGAHVKLATALLVTGQFAEGWKEFAWRFRTGITANPTLQDNAPIWNGSPIPGKTLLVHREQGLGDFIQCARYIPLLAAQGITVILRCQRELRDLLQQVDGVHLTIEDSGEKSSDDLAADSNADSVIVSRLNPPHDFQIPVFSLPGLFAADEHSIPRQIPYLRANPTKAEKFKFESANKRVGLVWAGSRAHGNDHRRSLTADELNALAGINGVEFHRLQMPPALAMPPPSLLKLIDHTADFKNLDDTAALIANLDLVISVDTSVAHLAGAMGKPVWILLPFAAEWRWMEEREDSPWYSTARLFRQPSPGDWQSVLRKVRDQLLVMATSW